MDKLPKDVITLIAQKIKTSDLYALLSVFDLKIDWKKLYFQKSNPVKKELKKIIEKHFFYTDKDRLQAAFQYFQEIDTSKDFSEDEDEDYTEIPIVRSHQYKLEEYVYDISEYIYRDIYEYKKSL